MTSSIQPSFTGGELSPSLYGRVDIARYQTSVRTMRNIIAQQYGGATNRPGTMLASEVHDSTRRHRLIPFEFNTTQTYVLEFGHLTMRVYKNGALVLTGGLTPYVLSTPYAESDLPLLKFTQSADVMTICHPNHAPRQLGRLADNNWSLSFFNFLNGPFQDVNVNKALTVSSSGTLGSVTLTASGFVFPVSSVGQLFYVEQPNYGAPWEPGKTVVLNQVVRSNGNYYVSLNSGTSGSLRPTNDDGDWNDGGVTWRFLHPGFGVAIITAASGGATATATVISRIPDALGSTYKWAFGAWGGDQGWPQCVSYYEQRQVFGGTLEQPQTVFCSKTGDFTNFGKRTPIADDDAFSFVVPGRQVNAVRHILPLDKMLLFTSGSEWIVKANDDTGFTPAATRQKVQGYRGSGDVPPLVIGNSAIYLQFSGGAVRDISYDFASDSYTGTDLTITSSHLFRNRFISEWAFAEVPFSCVWAVRSDGILLGMTYMREQQVVGWHRHDTDGLFESVASIREGRESATYVIVKRTINGVQRRFVERFATRQYESIRDAVFSDCSVKYDGRNVSATMIAINSAGGWSYSADTFTLNASASYFQIADVGSEIHFPVGEQVVRMEITAFSSGTAVTARANRDIPASIRGVATALWGHARRSFAGLSHLEGKSVAILADGDEHPNVTVVGGTIALQYAAVVVLAGLPYVCDLETLDLSLNTSETVRDKRKIVTAVRLIVEGTRGFKAGPNASKLFPFKERSDENYDVSVNPLTGLAEIRTTATWGDGGRVLIRQDSPLPLTVLAVIPEFEIGGA